MFAVLQSVFSWQVHNEELMQSGRAAQTYWHYLSTGHFGEALFENWESEFLQMGSYVLLTAYLVQRGSPESKPLDGQEGRRLPRSGDRRISASVSMARMAAGHLPQQPGDRSVGFLCAGVYWTPFRRNGPVQRGGGTEDRCRAGLSL